MRHVEAIGTPFLMGNLSATYSLYSRLRSKRVLDIVTTILSVDAGAPETKAVSLQFERRGFNPSTWLQLRVR